jgi:hypothetical protein
MFLDAGSLTRNAHTADFRAILDRIVSNGEVVINARRDPGARLKLTH